jgi:hypothetical protein
VNVLAPRWTRAVGWIGLATIAAAFVVAIVCGREALLQLGPACTFRALSGLVCPTCGTTRAVAALAQGDVLAAFRYNPAVPLVLALTIGACWQLARGRARLTVSTRIVLAVVAVVWVANIVSHHVIGVP